VLLIGCSRRELSEEEKKEQWDRQAQHQSRDYKPSDGAFGAKDFAKESKEASEKDTQETEKAAEEGDN